MIDDYLINNLFAQELLHFLCSEASSIFGFKHLWDPKLLIFEISDKIDFPIDFDEIFFAVLHIIKGNTAAIVKCFEAFHHKLEDDIDGARFAKCALKAAQFVFFSERYSHESFLGYCALVMGVAYNFLLLNPTCIPQRACEVIGHVLFTHQMTQEFYEEGSWPGLQDLSSRFNDCMEDAEKKRKRKQ